MRPVIYAARIAARFQLLKIWSASEAGDPREVLRSALDLVANNLNLKVERVPAILGENQIAGLLDRAKRQIQIATNFRSTSQRFTLAHEIGHFILHPGRIYFRDRELSSPGNHREYFEVEADAFAAEFLMPRKYLERVFREMFGGRIDGARAFGSLSPPARASAIASAHAFQGRFFAPLTDQFGVSQKAMGIQLLQMGLVK